MNVLFSFLFLFFLVVLIVGLAKPALIARLVKRRLSRKQIGLLFGIAAFAALLAVGITAPAKESADHPSGEPAQQVSETTQGTPAPATSTPSTSTAPVDSTESAPPAATPALPQESTQCDESLWAHVYNPQRLKRIEDCKAVTGTVAAIRKEDDGDYHVDLRLDAPEAGMINQKNIDDQDGDLVLEPVCQNKVTQADAQDACTNFTYLISIPAIGQHVTVLGDYVLDSEHGWNELHPVYSFTADGSQFPAAPAPQPAPAPAPAPAPSQPATGGIPCADGTVSHAQHRQGACSSHGGIAPGY